MNKLEYKDITRRIIGCAMKVHSTIGSGFQEVIYQRCLAIEFERNGLGFYREKEQGIFYQGIHVGTRRVDFLVENKVLVELKAVVNVDKIHYAQAINYLEAFGLHAGLLINFGQTSLEFNRLYNNNRSYLPPNQS
jgi:GxxExxY protein